MFKYKKLNKKFWKKFKLYKYVISKILFIIKVLHLDYILLNISN